MIPHLDIDYRSIASRRNRVPSVKVKVEPPIEQPWPLPPYHPFSLCSYPPRVGSLELEANKSSRLPLGDSRGRLAPDPITPFRAGELQLDPY